MKIRDCNWRVYHDTALIRLSQRFAIDEAEGVVLKNRTGPYITELGHGGKTCELVHGTTCRQRQNGRGHTKRVVGQSI